ncbi:MAG: alpha/beta fold hydrolase [Chloroflexi bacterium]|nr:alpha/beta fold hydrolase [Chloroflexota bacterium]
MFRLLVALSIIAKAGLLAVSWIISERVLHPPRKAEDHTLDDFDLPAREVMFLSRDGTRLAGWYVPAGGAPSPGIVLSHGHGRSRAELLPHANFLHQAGYTVLVFDYRHRGESEGTEVTMGLREQDDLQGAIDYIVVQPEVDARHIGVAGLSMGSVVALLVAAHDERIKTVVAECPYSAADAIMTRALEHFYHLPRLPFGVAARWLIERRLGQSLDVADAIDVIRRIAPRPIFLIADGADAVLGPEETRHLYDAAREPKRFWLVPGADHSRGWQAAPEEYERRVLEFLKESLRPSTPSLPSS